jgi:hypothetical protein
MFCSSRQLSIATIEKEGMPKLKAMICDLAQVYINAVSASIREDKRGRRKAGLILERTGDGRQLLTEMGELVYKRDYYLDKSTGRYRYLADELLEVEYRQRVSDNLGLSLVRAAREMSYAGSSRFVADGELSRQTVMTKVRDSQPKPETVGEKRRVSALHIDADEDHVTLTSGKKGIVPLVSVYEGIGQKGKRRYCKEVFHISEYGLGAEQLWEKVLDEIDARYDLDGTIIYLHGDGASWIKTGMEWLPNCRFVLDKYHKNQAIKSMCAGVGNQKLWHKVENGIRDSLLRNDSMLWSGIVESLVYETPENEKRVSASARYLWNHKDGISICATDPEANNGGCAEPHVSHVLSSRLSDRPRVWSESTLVSLAPILANCGELEVKNKHIRAQNPLVIKAAAKAKRIFKSKGTKEMRTPCVAGRLTPIAIGKINPTYTMLRHYAN